MEGNSVNKANKLPGWLDTFIETFSSKEVKSDINNDQIEKSAEINIEDLPKITWNDETFYVLFDDTGASIINGFKNVVTTLPGLTTIEEVNGRLNDKQIASEQNAENEHFGSDFENEIESALQETNKHVESEIENKSLDKTAEDIINEKFDKLKEELAEMINKKIAEMDSKNVEKIASTMEQYYARTNPGNIYNINNISEQELNKAKNEEETTKQQLQQENDIDRTVPEGKYKVLPKDSEETFKQAICPDCGGQLCKTHEDEKNVNIACKKCNHKFNVNKENEKIYIE